MLKASLIYIASFVIIASGLKAAGTVVFPFLLAVFIAIVISPAIKKLQELKLPRILAFILVMGVIFFALGSITNTVVKTLNGLLGYMPELQAKFKILTDEYIKLAVKYGFEINGVLPSGFDPNNIFTSVGGFLKSGTQIASKAFFIFLLVTFMLFETQIFYQKVEYFASKNPQTNLIVDTFISNLKRYLAIKSIASGATGIIIWLGLEFLGVPYASLWGIVACVLNFIPTIGSIIAAFPAILVSLLLNDISTCLWVATLYICVNVAIGNFIEPKFLGKGLGISTLVVLLSLLFWGFLFGVGGMFLAVPLTMSLKIALDANPSTKFIAVLLSDKVE
ncbi:AI-2E family transporter [Campylobacter sp. RM9344]|uniref:AI-2E family transporter n=1 Tax=Campylobacter californiensis TaxID=1032243 RepID=A0AAW3ZQS3_9BACT|nr:AI-2E family transporter [Campylobacter sp. RM6883]MBE2995124.1 AI-2E family transporter [Campylobacter sp. RM6913]MBE3029045.1 AI-2E family transporter [Campylobacter sp. RM9344]MBE3607402.1 AI-2E family transporter [Campylobacter sp. RM9337]